MPRKFPGSKEELIKRIESLGFKFLRERRIYHAFQLHFSHGVSANFYDNNTLTFQGANHKTAEDRWDNYQGTFNE